MAHKALSGLLLGSAALLAFSPAMAQSRDNYFARDRNISVRDRDRPGYQALGLRLGTFLAYPKVEIGIQGNDNIYSLSNPRVGDAVGLVSPEIDFVSQWSRNSLKAFVRSATRAYADHSSEDATDWQLGGTGQVDLGNTSTTIGGDYGYLAEPRYAAVGQNNTPQFATVHPIEYYQGDINGDVVHTFNRLQIEGVAAYQSYQFMNGKNAAGQLVDNQVFDYQRVNLTGKSSYAVSPDTAVYAAIGYNTLTYPTKTAPGEAVNPNSSGETYDLGANFDLTKLVRGDVELGYMQQSFNSGAISAIGGFHAVGNVQWFPTELITVTFNGQHNVTPSTISGAPAIITGSISTTADYELLRNLILTGQVQWQDNSYRGVDRDDKVSEFMLGGEYLMNRNIGLHLAYDFLTQNSTGLNRGLDFNENRITLSSTLQY